MLLTDRKYYRRVESHYDDVFKDKNDLEQSTAYADNADETNTADDDAETLEDVFVHLLDQEEAIIQQ